MSSTLALRATAYHESAHAVAAYHMHVAVHAVSVVHGEGMAGHVKLQRLLKVACNGIPK
jgi:hypothetical protein